MQVASPLIWVGFCGGDRDYNIKTLRILNIILNIPAVKEETQSHMSFEDWFCVW